MEESLALVAAVEIREPGSIIVEVVKLVSGEEAMATTGARSWHAANLSVISSRKPLLNLLECHLPAREAPLPLQHHLLDLHARIALRRLQLSHALLSLMRRQAPKQVDVHPWSLQHR